MIPLVREKLPEITALCDKYRVRKLDVFGSASTGNFGPESDIDFLVEFAPVSAREHYDFFFGLLDELKSVLKKEVDLVEEQLIHNPYLIASISAQRETVFERPHQSTPD
jgi:predicted nucleotidyltransferase